MSNNYTFIINYKFFKFISQGDGDGEGGSDVGAFLGGLLGAIIQGSANPPGPVSSYNLNINFY